MVSHQSCCKGHISTDGGLSFKEELKYLTQLPFQGFCGQMIKKKNVINIEKVAKTPLSIGPCRMDLVLQRDSPNKARKHMRHIRK